MIKIIKQGNKPKYNVICPQCRAELQYEDSDLITTQSINTSCIPYIICPCCGKTISHFSSGWYDIMPTIPIINEPTGIDACENCANNPKNGGSGICFCILGLPKFT